MKKFKKAMLLLLILIIPSIAMYTIQYKLFGDMQYILESLISQLAFLPLYYFFTTIIIERIFSNRDKQEKAKKVNMLIGVFFSELGNDLIKLISAYHIDFENFREKMLVTEDWSEKDFLSTRNALKKLDYKIDSKNGNLNELKQLLVSKRSFLVTMMENQNLHEHESFTDLILAIFHFCEELEHRQSFDALPRLDYDHISGDIERVYILLIIEWLNYMRHLKKEYTYLFSLSVRINPFCRKSSIIFNEY